MGRRPSASQRSSVRQRQMRPRPCMAMKLIASGVTNWAAIVRSPSFSRSASSTTMTNLPERKSSIAASIALNGVAVSGLVTSRLTSRIVALASPWEQAFDVLREHVDLEIYLAAGLQGRQRRRLQRERNERDRERVVRELRDGERYAVERHRALLDEVTQNVR